MNHFDRSVAGVFIAMMLAGFCQVAAAVWHLKWEIPTWQAFRTGLTTAAIDKKMDINLPAQPALIAIANSLRYLVLRGGGPQVHVGRDGWLFLTEELRYTHEGPHHLQARIVLLQTASERLRTLGVRLMVALVPDKARVYPQYLWTGTYPAALASRYFDTMTKLKDAGVNAVDLLTPLRQAAKHTEVYYHSDTHWNQNGAQVAAQAIAHSLASLTLSKTAFTTSKAAIATERPGDLIRLMGLEKTPSAFRPPSDWEYAESTQPLYDDLGLFDDAAVPVVLTGTSYSLRGNFHGHLQQALSARVLNAAQDGGGFLNATTAYLTNDAFQQSKPQVLIWEIPERFMLMPLEEEPHWLQKIGWSPSAHT